MDRWIEGLRIWGWVTAAASLATGGGLWLVFSRQMPPQVPLWYSQPWGEAQLGRPAEILVLPAMAMGIGVACGWISKRLMRHPPLSAMLAAASIVTQVILMLGMLRIVLLVI